MTTSPYICRKRRYESQAKRALFVFFATISTTSSFIPRFRMVSIIPGMESRAPDLTETSKGSFLIAKFFPDGFLDFCQRRRDLRLQLWRIGPVMSVKVSAYFGRDGESRLAPADRCASFRGDSRLCHPAAISYRLIHLRARPRSNKRSVAFSFFSPECAYLPVVSVFLMCAESDFRTVDLRLVAIFRMRKNRQGRTGQSSFECRPVNDPENSKSRVV